MSKRLLGGIIGCKDKISYLFGNSHLTNLHDGVSCFGSNDEARQEEEESGRSRCNTHRG